MVNKFKKGDRIISHRGKGTILSTTNRVASCHVEMDEPIELTKNARRLWCNHDMLKLDLIWYREQRLKKLLDDR